MMTSHFNIKPREVYCPKCKVTIVSDVAAPVCEECFGQPMFTVIYSGMTGKRITGADELGSGDSKPTQ